ncbi:Holliday junction branch migration protein RuvA [Pleionea sp. CnH1-48]|uniref:Holliday junction branch migration protein RuvA n=1 Tax=Pleionea sp. CnH1-48 TaxID=2954494 RepID=UPI0020981F88|nr:Holliday junction branch migration protein RuvA [Pleionea sp. CnH1-48]
MIGRLKGTLIEKSPPDLLIDVQGVGYEVHAPMTTIFNLPEVGREVVLYTHLSVSENLHSLYAFGSKKEKQLFRELIKVNGVGPKLALAILSGMTADEFVRCVHDGDAAVLVKLPGVGKKTAERLIIEMRDRLKDWGTSASDTSPEAFELVAGQGGGDSVQEATSALVALGYKPQDASKAINKVKKDANTSEDLIRLALKNMGK